MATEAEWSRYVDAVHEGEPTGNAVHARKVRETPLEAKAILSLVLENMSYANDSYYDVLWRPVEMRVAEFYASIGEKEPGS
jgi:hypothetical protein